MLDYHPRNDDGQGLIEYALILVLVAIVILVILGLFGETLSNVYTDIINQLDAVM